MVKILFIIILLPILSCASLKSKDSAFISNIPDFINNVPTDNMNKYFIAKVNKYSNFEQNKNWAFNNDLPYEILV